MIPEFTLHENLAKEVVFVDGITGCGKVVLGGILASLDKTEHVQVLTMLEQVLPATALGAVDLSFARAFFRLRLNETAYNSLIARHTNFRMSDSTGIFKFRDPTVYLRRLGGPEGQIVVDTLREQRHIFVFQTHEFLVNLETLNRLSVPYRMIEVVRDPVDMAYSWWKRDWGTRFGTDPRAFTLTVAHGDCVLPWYAVGHEAEWIELNAAERCVKTVIDLTERAVRQYQASSAEDKQRILIIRFEQFIGDPVSAMAGICTFVNTVATASTAAAIERDAVSPNLEPVARQVRAESLMMALRLDLRVRLQSLQAAYIADGYGVW